MIDHKKYIRRCIYLAEKAKGLTYPNPMVGCVIVHQDKIIGEGYHHKAGQPHAEINAINSVKDKSVLQKASIYVSLEPCAHYGKTPPCALKLKEIGFKQVIIGTLDAHDKVNGKGINIIESNPNTEIITNILKEECRFINKRFFTFHEKKRPYIILKWAESSDGFIDKNFHPFPISNKISSQIVHQLRASEEGILVGTKTALVDNPSLTVRHVNGINPTRIVIDLELKIPTNFTIYNEEANTIVFNSFKNDTFSNVELIKIDKDNLIPHLFDELYARNIQSIIVEGGAYTLQKFIDEEYWDEIIRIQNIQLILKNGTVAPNLPFSPNKIEQIREDTVSTYYRQN